MEAKRDYYEVLGLARDADEKTIREAFRGLALKYHPDRNKSPGAEERFKEIAEAYAVLSDSKKRAEYDARGFGGVSAYSAEDLIGGIDFEDLFGGMGIDFGFGPGLFEQVFGIRGAARRARSGRQRRRRGRDIESEVEIPLEMVLRGGERDLRFTLPGEGRAREISVRIPPGVEDGVRLRVEGQGFASPDPGGAPGDLYLAVRISPDPRFSREGADLWSRVWIPVTGAVLGMRVPLPTFEGESIVSIPPGTQPEMVLRLKGKGLPEWGGSRRGDLFLRIGVEIPERLSAEERELYERLRRSGQAGSGWRSA